MKKNQLFIETEYARELGEYKIPRYNELPDFDVYMEQLIEKEAFEAGNNAEQSIRFILASLL